MTADAPVVAVVGATGAAGSTVLRILDERAFPCREFRALASERSVGSQVQLAGSAHTVQVVSDAALAGCDIVFFAAGAATARQYAPVVAAGGGVAIDKSSEFRMNPDVPLIVPEVNAEEVGRHRGIVANPNCVAIPLAIELKPLDENFGVRHVTVATYQAASGGGRRLVEELHAQVGADAEGLAPVAAVYPHVLHGNVIPGGWAFEGADTEEEVKVAAETQRVLGRHDLGIAVTTVRVPVDVGHSAACWIEFHEDVAAEAAREVLSAARGVRVLDDPSAQAYPTPRHVAGTDDVVVGRIRADHTRPSGIALFFAADNLRKGAATNAIQVAELVLAGK